MHSEQNHRLFERVVQLHPNVWHFLQCMKQEESIIVRRMDEAGLGFSVKIPKKPRRQTVRKIKQIAKLLRLLSSNKSCLAGIQSSLTYLVSDLVAYGK